MGVEKMQSVYDWLCEHSDEDGFLSANGRMISHDTGIPTRTVQTYLQTLGNTGLIHVLEPGRTSGVTTRWAVTELAELD
jgi:hypothetical protein